MTLQTLRLSSLRRRLLAHAAAATFGIHPAFYHPTREV